MAQTSKMDFGNNSTVCSFKISLRGLSQPQPRSDLNKNSVALKSTSIYKLNSKQSFKRSSAVSSKKQSGSSSRSDENKLTSQKTQLAAEYFTRKIGEPELCKCCNRLTRNGEKTLEISEGFEKTFEIVRSKLFKCRNGTTPLGLLGATIRALESGLMKGTPMSVLREQMGTELELTSLFQNMTLVHQNDNEERKLANLCKNVTI